ncbi:MAG: glycosyltransferase family 4 protein [Anaerolineae bacterium]|nr:glycosyltransferase family 4 protein [Anaerolineae bacterium]
MRIGIAIEETWDFLHEIDQDLGYHHQKSIFKTKQYDPPFLKERVNRWRFEHDLRTFMRSNDVVFFEWASRLLAAATHLPKTCGIVTRLHRYEMYKWTHLINWDAVDKIILVSQSKKEEFLTRHPEQASKIIVINEAVDPNKFHPQTKTFNGDIGTLCHLTPRKRVYELILTFYDLLKQRDDLHLHIGGGEHVAYGDYYYSLHDVVKRLNIQDKVTFYDNVKDTHNWYHKVDIFISNAYSEGLQVAPIEAMASGCYCLAHWWGGADELLPEPYLYYTESQLQEKILHYCDLSSADKQAQKEYMRSIVCEKFDIHQAKVQIRKIIEAVGRNNTASKHQVLAPVRQISQ